MVFAMVISMISCKENQKNKEAENMEENVPLDSTDLALLELDLPEGFKIEVYARCTFNGYRR